MQLPQQQRRSNLGPNMTPMIDIVFLLIIFFLVSSQLARQETNVELELPDAASSREETTPPESRRLVINVLEDGQLVVAGAALARESLDRVLAVETQAGGGELEVRIRTDRAVPYHFVEPILVSCAAAGVWKVTFAVLRREGS